jgi:phosphomannomutase
VALILHLLARTASTVSTLVSAAPRYTIVKGKGPRGKDLQPVYRALRSRFPDAQVDDRDGLRLAWPDRWVHLRPSGTEPIIRFIAEAPTRDEANQLVEVCQQLLA